MSDPSRERAAWRRVEDLLGNDRLLLGDHWSYNLADDPKRLAFVLSRYKFAARLIGRNRKVLELGCSEGLAGVILAEFAEHYTGVDSDHEAIVSARRNWDPARFTFHEDDFLGKSYGQFDAVVSMDVVEHIEPAFEQQFFLALWQNLTPSGIGIIGTPNLTSSPYASPVSLANHINLFDAARFRSTLTRYFERVFIFGMNDEVVHTGFLPMAHFLIGVGCCKRKKIHD